MFSIRPMKMMPGESNLPRNPRLAGVWATVALIFSNASAVYGVWVATIPIALNAVPAPDVIPATVVRVTVARVTVARVTVARVTVARVTVVLVLLVEVFAKMSCLFSRSVVCTERTSGSSYDRWDLSK